jgi:copper chaperone
MSNLVLTVPDISCAHCKSAIETAVGAVAGVTEVTVDVAAKTVTVDGDAPRDTLVAAIEDAGYDVPDPA